MMPLTLNSSASQRKHHMTAPEHERAGAEHHVRQLGGRERQRRRKPRKQDTAGSEQKQHRHREAERQHEGGRFAASRRLHLLLGSLRSSSQPAAADSPMIASWPYVQGIVNAPMAAAAAIVLRCGSGVSCADMPRKA